MLNKAKNTVLSFIRRPLLEHDHTLTSPNGRLVCHIELKFGHLVYSLKKDDKVVLRESRMGFTFQGEEPIGEGLSIVRLHERTHDETWERPWGEERLVHDHYNEVAVYLSEISGDKRLFTVRFRLFDDGLAFRYEFPPQPKFQRLIIADELTEFNVDSNARAWKIPAYQPDRYEYNYECWPVDTLIHSVHTPLTIATPMGDYISIHEAALYDYGSMTIKLNNRRVLQSDITPLSDGMKAYVDLPFNTPWRVIMIGGAAIELTQNRIIYNLNPAPAETQDFSWVKPLKFMGIWWAMFVGEWTWARGDRHGATTAHATEYINAAKRLGIKGLLVEGWNNGWDGDWLQNGADSDFLTPTDDFDLPNLARYAKASGIELIGHHETVGFIDNYEAQLERAYKYYTSLGIHYIKSGYAGSMMTTGGKKEFHHSQIGVRHYQRTVELAAKYGIMLDIHEPIKGTGIERTWPNLLTREGARGQEYEGGALSPSHACILPFTRLLAGGMDYTSGIFDVTNEAKRLHSTLARQLAFYVTIYSGMQMAADRPRFYEKVRPDAYKFIHDVPVNFEKSIPLIGEIGTFYVVARQGRGEPNWYIGGVTNEEAHKVRLSLEFLEEGQYLAEIYRDGEDAHYRDNQLSIIIESRPITRSDYLEIWMAPGGGFAVKLKKQ
ncbi:glycoside hydrolase family 97 protein [Candidatus Saccharibacteria bacterium]|nr:glycoside hydrolase family 97 protein [Candidatus Saccharibacteria bacterium]